jgi:hypothetical protein
MHALCTDRNVMWTHGPRTDLYTSTERATVQRDLAKIFELLTVELL